MSTNTITTILGRKGKGKTTLAAELAANEPRVIVLDTMGGYGEYVDQVIWGRDESIIAMRDIAAKKKRFRLALRVIEQDDTLDILDMAWEIEDYLLILEETSIICGTPPFLHAPMARLVRYGRHRQISQIYIARRPTELPRDLTAQSDLIVTFQQKEKRDLDYLAASGFDPMRVYRLPDFKCEAVGEIDLPLPVAKRLTKGATKGALLDPPEDSDLTEETEESTPVPDQSEPASPD